MVSCRSRERVAAGREAVVDANPAAHPGEGYAAVVADGIQSDVVGAVELEVAPREIELEEGRSSR